MTNEVACGLPLNDGARIEVACGLPLNDGARKYAVQPLTIDK